MPEDARMVVPMLVFTLAAAVFGVWSGPVGQTVAQIGGTVLP